MGTFKVLLPDDDNLSSEGVLTTDDMASSWSEVIILYEYLFLIVFNE